MACSETALEKYTLVEKGVEYVFRRSATLEEENIGPNSHFYCKEKMMMNIIYNAILIDDYRCSEIISYLSLLISRNLLINHSMIAKVVSHS